MQTNMLLHLRANSLKIQSHPLQHIDCHTLSKFDQSQQQVFRSHVGVVEPLGLLERKRQHLLGAWSEILHDCFFDAGARSLTLLKVDPASTRQNLTPKPKEIDHCHDCLSISSCEFSPQSPSLATHRTSHQFLVHRSDNNTLLICFPVPFQLLWKTLDAR